MKPAPGVTSTLPHSEPRGFWPTRGRALAPTSFGFLLLLGLLGALPPLSIDIVAPTLPSVRAGLQVSQGAVGMVITLFMVGFALGQVVAGPFSDTYGRRPVLLLGMLAYAISALGCALVGSLAALVLCRIAQGVGAGACTVLTFAIVRDLFKGDAARVKRSYLTVIFGVTPMVAPLVGALIADAAGWAAVYFALAGFGATLLVISGLFLSESLTVQGKGKSFAGAWRHVMADSAFARIILVNSLSYAAVFTYVAASSFVLIEDYGMSPLAYGAVFAATAAALTAGAMVSGRCARAGIGHVHLLRWSLQGGGIVTLLLGILLAVKAPPAGVIGLLIVALFSRGISAPNLQHCALEPMEHCAGTAAALLGVAQILSGAVASAGVTLLLPLLGRNSMGMLMAGFAGSAGLAWLLLVSRRS